MPLAVGTKLGPYEIIAPLGAGGMGEVYRARDSRLDRDVALKVLPAKLSSDSSLKQRLEREAKAVSRLSHPNICGLHDIGHQDGVDYLVMEFLDGETLEQRLFRGPLPAEQTLRYAVQIADALAKAHKLGITHRDLKPANVMLTKSGAKLMDFGLAKQSGTAPLATALTEMTAPQTKLTEQGMIVGTFQYMAPEQLEGKDVDARTDIFAFGELLYEMITGKPAFSGKSRASLIAAILTTEPPPISQLQPIAPPALERVVRKCLAKDPDERWQSASDLASELNWIHASGSQPAIAVPVTSSHKRSQAAIQIATATLAVLLATYLGWRIAQNRAAARPNPIHLAVTLPNHQALFNQSTSPMAISPDGTTIAYTAYREDHKSQLYLRKLDSFEGIPIQGTEGASCPFFSPNGEWLAFIADSKLKKLLVHGGSPVVVADQATLAGVWAKDDTIYFNRFFTSGIFAVSAAGGQPRQVTKPGPAPDDRGHLWPDVLPDNDAIIFTVWTGPGKSFADSRIEALSFKSGKRKVLIEGGTGARRLPDGQLAYTRNGTLFVIGFDPKTLEVKGAPMPVIDGVMSGTANGDSDFAVSTNGTLVYQPGTFLSYQRNLVQLDRTGKVTNITSEVKPYGELSLSPDGKQVALTLQASSFDVWIYDPGRDTFTRASFGGDEYRPHFSPDGKMLGYDSSKGGNQDIYVKRGITQGEEIKITEGPEYKQFAGFTPDGREIIFSRVNKDTGWDLYAASIEGDHKPRPLVVAPFNQTDPRLSPDGKWLAYVSDESGQQEVFVQSLADPSMRAQVSSEGGDSPRWSPSNNELFFKFRNRLMSVKFASGNTLNPGKPTMLFEDKVDWNYYDVAPDGRFVVARDADTKAAGNQINVVLHWLDEIKKK